MERKRAQHTVVSCLLLVVVTLACYGRVNAYPFINYDDEGYVTHNQSVQAGLTGKTFAWAWTTTEQYNWHPLTWLSHALDCQLYGLNPSGHHLTSAVLHCLNVLLVFFLLLWGTGRPETSLLVAALFALHPFNVESVVWIAERKNVLCTFFFLLAIGAYGWYATKPNVKRYALLAVLFALGLASKPMVITLPFVLLLLDYWPLQRIQGWEPLQAPSTLSSLKAGKSHKAHAGGLIFAGQLSVRPETFSRLVLEKLPLLMLCAASAGITMVAQASGGAVRSLARFPFWVRLQNSIYSYAMYLWKTFWPNRFALYYPHPLTGLAPWRLGLATVFLVAVSLLVWQQRARRKYLVTGWLWYLGTLVPVIGIVQVGDQAMADRYAYIPLIGVFVMVVWTAADLADSRAVQFPLKAGAAMAILATLSFLTWRQLGYWESSYDVWSHTAQITDPNPLIEGELGDALRSLDRFEDALPHFQNAASMQPGDPIRRVDLAEDLGECGQLQDAAEQYEQAIALSTSGRLQSQSYESLATLYGELGDYVKARDSYRQAVMINPKLNDEMLGRARQYVANNPSGGTYMFLGMLLQESGQLPAARSAYAQALKLDPDLAAARQSLDASVSDQR